MAGFLLRDRGGPNFAMVRRQEQDPLQIRPGGYNRLIFRETMMKPSSGVRTALLALIAFVARLETAPVISGLTPLLSSESM